MHIDKDKLAAKFKALYPDADKGSVHVSSKAINVTLESQSVQLPFNFHKLMQIADIFGTTNFDVNHESERHDVRYSSWTSDSWTEYKVEYTVKLSDLPQSFGEGDMEEPDAR